MRLEGNDKGPAVPMRWWPTESSAPRIWPIESRSTGVRNGRSTPRFRTVFRTGRVVTRNDTGLCLIRSLSEVAMTVDMNFDVSPGDRAVISLSEQVDLQGSVAWTSCGTCRIRLDHEIDTGEILGSLLREQQQSDFRPLRMDVAGPAVIFSEFGIHSVELRNVSHRGISFRHSSPLPLDGQVKLLFENGSEHRGVLRWSEAGFAGVLLTDAFDRRELISIKSLNRPEGIKPL